MGTKQNSQLRTSDKQVYPLRGKSYVPLPEVLAKKKAIINVQNDDDKCFLWAVLSALHPVDKHPQTVTKYKTWEHEFDEAFNGIEFPVKLLDVSKFAKRTNTSINAYCFNNGLVAPLEVTKEEKQKHTDLLYYNQHYCWIKDSGRLVGSQVKNIKINHIFAKCV